jgi:hypothetical protein
MHHCLILPDYHPDRYLGDNTLNYRSSICYHPNAKRTNLLHTRYISLI